MPEPRNSARPSSGARTRSRAIQPIPSDTRQLAALLRQHGVDVNRWGTAAAKSVEHLRRELEQGESVLLEEDGQLVREVAVVEIDVVGPREEVRLHEDRQEYRDGRTRRRSLGGALNEKLHPGETPDRAARRALREELGISDARLALVPLDTVEDERESPSYPGLRSRYLVWRYRLRLPPRHFRPEGYVEEQDDKATYFRWRRR